MALDRVLADGELSGDVAVLHSTSYRICDLPFAVGETMEGSLGGGLRSARIICEAAHYLPSQFVRERQFAGCDHANSLEQTLRPVTFHDQAPGPETDCLSIISIGFGSGKDHSGYEVAGAVECAQNLEPIKVWHEQVKHQDFGMVALHHV